MADERADWRYILCPLPVLRRRDGETDADTVIELGVCGEELDVEELGVEPLLAHGPTGAEVSTWQISCRLGHIVVLPDDEGNDAGHVPLDWDLVRGALLNLGVTYRSVL